MSSDVGLSIDARVLLRNLVEGGPRFDPDSVDSRAWIELVDRGLAECVFGRSVAVLMRATFAGRRAVYEWRENAVRLG